MDVASEGPYGHFQTQLCTRYLTLVLLFVNKQQSLKLGETKWHPEILLMMTLSISRLEKVWTRRPFPCCEPTAPIRLSQQQVRMGVASDCVLMATCSQPLIYCALISQVAQGKASNIKKPVPWDLPSQSRLYPMYVSLANMVSSTFWSLVHSSRWLSCNLVNHVALEHWGWGGHTEKKIEMDDLTPAFLVLDCSMNARNQPSAFIWQANQRFPPAVKLISQGSYQDD